MKLLIVRHADPDYSIDSLTEKGWREAELLSRRLSALDIAACYMSPLGRAQDTASLTLRKVQKTAETCQWLREFAPRIQRPDVTERKMITWDWLPEDWCGEALFFDAQGWRDVPVMQEGAVGEEYDWVVNGLDALLERHGYRRKGRLYEAVCPSNDTIVLFCHFGVECVLLSHLLNISPMVLWHGACAAPSSVTTLVTEERREGTAYFRMSAFGDISHLYAGGEPPAFAARFCECFANEDERHD